MAPYIRFLMRYADQKITPQCGDLLEQSKAQINLDLSNPQLAQAFKAGFFQTIKTLDTP